MGRGYASTFIFERKVGRRCWETEILKPISSELRETIGRCPIRCLLVLPQIPKCGIFYAPFRFDLTTGWWGVPFCFVFALRFSAVRTDWLSATAAQDQATAS